MDRLFSLSDTQAGLLTEPVLPSFIIFNPKQLYSMLLLRTSATLLLGLSSLQASPVITEFLASNATGITDENGDTSDWIEIHNPDTEAISLANWSLTDDTTNLTKWTLPDVNIAAGEYLVVFASNKDRTIPGNELHTNFKLSSEGEYLALVSPSFAPSSEFQFPPQDTDFSYGTSTISTNIVLVTESSPAKVRVPDLAYDGTVGTTWRDDLPIFDDSSWQSGNLGIGIERTSGFQDEIGIDIEAASWSINSTVYIRVPIPGIINPANIETLTLRMKYDDGFAAFINGSYAAGANAPSPLLWNSNAWSGVQDSNALEFQDFDLTASISQLNATDNLLAIQGLNQFSNSGDMLIRPELVATLTNPAPPVIGYFSSPTPGAKNPGNNTETPIGAPSDAVTISEVSGIKTSSISVTITAAVANAEVRYTLDGSEPMGASPLYTASLNIFNPTQLRARAFEPGRIGGPIAVGDYAFLDASLLNYLSDIPVLVMDNFGAGNYPNKGRSNDGHDVRQVARQANVVSIFQPSANGQPFSNPPTTESRAGCRVRGSSSSTFTRKPLSLEFWKDDDSDRKVSPLGFPAEADWVLNPPNPSFDRALIHNPVSFKIAKALGALAPGSEIIAVFQNTNGGNITRSDLKGIYIFTEKVERNRMGLDFNKIDERGQTGGWMINVDRMPAIPVGFPANTIQPNFHAAGPNGILQIPDDQQNSGGSQSVDDISVFYHSYLNFHTPNGYGILSDQRNEIQSSVRALDAAVWANNATDPTFGYQAHLDSESWARFFAVHNLAKNQDAHVLSSYLYRESPTSKIKMGPVWDFDRAYTWKGGATSTPLWAGDRDWFPGLFKDINFRQTLQDVWQEARRTTASNTALEGMVSDSAAGINSGQVTTSGLGYSTWLGRIDAMSNYVVNRANYLDNQYEPLPSSSPESNTFSGSVDLVLTPTSGGTIYFTTDGTDPRLDGGLVSAAATAYSAPLNLTQRTRIIARTKDGAKWSGPIERNLYQLSEIPQLVISEIHYHPSAPSPGEMALGFEDKNDFEFLEIENIGAAPAILSLLSITGGITFDLATGDIPILASGGRVLFVRNKTAFEARYGTSHPIAGVFSGSLNNAGDAIALKDTILDLDLQNFSYLDQAPWPICADGDGFSLILKNPSTDPDHSLASNWRCSSKLTGNPGESDARTVFSGDPLLDSDGDGLGQLIEHFLGTSDSSTTDGSARIHMVYHMGDDNLTYPALKVTFDIGADDVVSSGQCSSDLNTWSSTSENITPVNYTLNGDGTATMIWRSMLSSAHSPQFFRLLVTQN